MAIFAIADLHLSLGADKPMDIFPGWQDYVQKLEKSWRQLVAPTDTVVLPGDSSWAMKLGHCGADFAFIQSLPGQKWLLKGNHDYWWSTRSKMEQYVAAQGFDSIGFIHNNAVLAEGVALCGTRSWMYEPGQPHDEKVMARELGRLQASLEDAHRQAPEAEKLVFLHYPPVFAGSQVPQVVDLLRQFGVRRCFYGHLHGPVLRRAVQGLQGGVDYALVSADGLGFAPLQISTGVDVAEIAGMEDD